ncbi:hypothetical protein TRVL_06272 [Trypanosoma vivax]|nr:hypothetical protein TRVL_06272 [Trypanosoma vivax]
MGVPGAVTRGSSGIRWFGMRTHHKHAKKVRRKMKADTLSATPLLQRSLQCPYCPMKCALKQSLTVHLEAKNGRPIRQTRNTSLKEEYKESEAHLLECPSLRDEREHSGLENVREGELFFSAELATFLQELFTLAEPSKTPTDEPETKPTRAVKRHRSPTQLETNCSPSAAAKHIWVCTARAIG